MNRIDGLVCVSPKRRSFNQEISCSSEIKIKLSTPWEKETQELPSQGKTSGSLKTVAVTNQHRKSYLTAN